MRLTPLDIRKQEFSRGLRGYEAEDVDAFLQMVSSQWEDLLDEVRRQSEEIRDLQNKLAHYEKVEEALQEALQTARESSKKSIENAEQKAALLIERAEAQADDIKREAEIERHQLKRETAKLSSRKSEIVTRLRAFLMSEMELLASYEGDDPVGFIKLLPAEKRRFEQRAERGAREQDQDQAPKGMPDTTEADSTEPGTNEPDIYKPDTNESAPAEHATPPPSAPMDRASDESHQEPDAAQPENSFDDFDDDVPADVTAADHAEQERYWYDTLNPDALPKVDDTDQPHREDASQTAPEEGEDESNWTTQTYISGSSEQPPQGRQGGAGKQEDDEETRASSEEIEKIRRILSDLD